MRQPADVAREHVAQIGDAVFQHGQAVDAEAEGEALVFVGVDAAVLQHIGVHHPAAEDFQPVAALSDLELDERSRHLLDGLGRKRLNLYSSNYWSSRPVISARLDGIFRRWDKEGKISPDDWEFARKSFKGAVADFESDRHPVGSLRWIRGGVPVTIMGKPQIDKRGNTLVEVLTPHSTLSLDIQCLFIRAPK